MKFRRSLNQQPYGVIQRIQAALPITPFTERVRELYEAVGVSSVLVIGGSGEFLSVADQIILMDNFVPKNVTQEAKNLCEHDKPRERIPLAKWEIERKITTNHFSSYPEGSDEFTKFAKKTL